MNEVMFSPSTFAPVALGFFGLGTGYLIYGPQELLKPWRGRGVDLTTGIWGIWMPGFLQFVTGVLLWIGLAWFHSFREPPLYMAALAFTAYGVHWWALGMGRAFGGDPRPNGLMAISFTVISILGAVVFFHAGDAPVGVLFLGLTAVYVSEFFASLWIRDVAAAPGEPAKRVASPIAELGERALGIAHIATGIWLLYLAVAVTLNLAAGATLPA
jgi:hypothetical protein